MEMEGGGAISKFFRVTLIYLSPTTFVVLLMSIVNSFRVFKEVYILYGGYPSTEIYMLQHYMNNQFLSLSMQKLASAAYLMFLVIGIVLLLLYRIQKKLTDNYQ
jgi:multiple sugar transport system permease protein